MSRPPLPRGMKATTEVVAIGNGDNVSYSMNVGWGRAILASSMLFHIGNRFVGAVRRGKIVVRDSLTGQRVSNDVAVGHVNRGQVFLALYGDATLADGEVITVGYQWEPHELHGSRVMVEVNGEVIPVPIQKLQSALNTYLGDK